MPFFGVKTPNFTPGFGDVRDYIIVCNEASDAKYQGLEVRCMVYMLDVTAWKNPMMADIFRVPDADFLTQGGRFGPHQFNETQNNKLYRPQDNRNLLYVAYFAGGMRVLDISDPYDMKEVGYYVPKTTSTTIPRLKTMHPDERRRSRLSRARVHQRPGGNGVTCHRVSWMRTGDASARLSIIPARVWVLRVNGCAPLGVDPIPSPRSERYVQVRSSPLKRRRMISSASAAIVSTSSAAGAIESISPAS